MAETVPDKGFFYYTQGKAWGGSQLDSTTFKIITVLFGFFGLDHLLLRSPITAILKFIVNLLSLGFWYWYDVLQVFSDFDNFKKYGYSIPIVGPSGLGAGLIHDPGKAHAPDTSPSPFLFLAFALTSLIPYGISHVIAGDYLGAFFKFTLSVTLFTFLFGWLWAFYTFGNMMLNSKSLFENGTDRLFPLSVFIGQYGPAPNLQVKATEPTAKEDICGPSFFETLSKYFFLIPKFLMDKLFPPVKKAVEITIEKGKEIVDQTKKVVEPPVREVTKLATEVPQVLTDTVTELASYTDPSKLTELAEKQAGKGFQEKPLDQALQQIQKVQSGGASFGLDTSSLFNIAVVGILLATILGGLTVTYMRINKAKTEHNSEKNDVPPTVRRKERDDTPPGPSVL